MSDKGQTNFIARISVAFVKRFRVTLILFLAILAMGAFTYTDLLKREGLPEIAFPVVFVQAPYFADDAQVVDREVAIPVENELADVEGIEEIRSTITDNYYFSIVFFQTDYTTEEGLEFIEEELYSADLGLPEGVELQIEGLSPSYDGKHDVLLGITSKEAGKDLSVKELQSKAQFLAQELDNLRIVVEANSIDLVTEEFNPANGETFEFNSTFNRYGRVEDGELKYQNSILVGLIKDDKSSTVEFSDEVRAEIDQLLEEPELDGVQINYVADFREDLDRQIGSLETNAASALIAVVIVLFLFVNWRAAIVTAIFIPTVMAATFIAMFLLGLTLNIISLFALILVLGLFVDDAIVVVEIIDYYKKQGARGLQAISEGVKSIGIADVAGTVTTLIVFFPMLTITGILGDYIIPIPTTVIISLILSLLIALTVIPFLAFILIPDSGESKRESSKTKAAIDLLLNGFSRGVMKVGEMVAGFVRLYLSKWYYTLGVIIVSIVLIVGGMSFANQLKFSLFPPQDDSEGVIVNMNYEPNLTVSEKEQLAKIVEKEVKQNYEDVVEEVKYVFVGRDFFGTDRAEIWILLKPMNEREITSVEIADELSEKLDDLDGARAQVIEIQVGGPTEEFQFRAQVYDNDTQKLEQVTSDIEQYLKNIELEADTEVLEVITENLFTVSKIDSERYAEVLVKIDDPTNSGAVLELEEKMRQEFDEDKLAEYLLGEDAIEYNQGIESENLESFNSALFALAFSLIVMYGLLVLQFDSFLQPFLIFLAIPFSFVGLFPGLYATDNALSFFVVLGITALVGIVVNNTIMLLDFVNQERNKGKSINESVSEAVKVRFRPLVTTSVTTVVGLLPLAFNDPFWESLAFTIVFGLIASTTMVTLVFPAYYAVIERIGVAGGSLAKRVFGSVE